MGPVLGGAGGLGFGFDAGDGLVNGLHLHRGAFWCRGVRQFVLFMLRRAVGRICDGEVGAFALSQLCLHESSRLIVRPGTRRDC